MEEDIVISEIKMKRLRNLKMFKGKSDEEIYEFYRNRDPKPEKPPKAEDDDDGPALTPMGKQFEKKYYRKLRTLQDEYGDMNQSDTELLRTLARISVQAEIINNQILTLQQEDEIDSRTLKNLGDYQRQIVQSMNDIQDKLGIARKQRKDQQSDDVAVFIENLKHKAKEFYDKQTVAIRCEKDKIELARYWLNFPKNAEIVHFEGTCWKCGEKRIYTREVNG